MDMESIGIRDFLEYRYLSNVKYAPDGKRAFFCHPHAHAVGDKGVGAVDIGAVIAWRYKRRR